MIEFGIKVLIGLLIAQVIISANKYEQKRFLQNTEIGKIEGIK